MEQFFLQHEAIISMCVKAFAAIGGVWVKNDYSRRVRVSMMAHRQNESK